jgi:hypothetical protein
VEPFEPVPDQQPYSDPWLQNLDAYLRPRLASLPMAWLAGPVEITAYLDLDALGRVVDAGLTTGSGAWQLDQQVVAVLRGSAPYPPPPPAWPGRFYLRLGCQPQGLAYLYIFPAGY